LSVTLHTARWDSDKVVAAIDHLCAQQSLLHEPFVLAERSDLGANPRRSEANQPDEIELIPALLRAGDGVKSPALTTLQAPCRGRLHNAP
jgi:hypothetical protein